MKGRSSLLYWSFWGIAFLAIPLWYLSYPETTIKHQAKPFWVYGSQLFALLGYALFAVAILLSVRSRFIEHRLGGLDKVYQLHHSIAKAAFYLLFLHPVFLALRWIPQNMEKVSWYLFPVHRRLEIDLGSWAWWGLLLIMIFTLAIKIAYHRWKLLHRFTGLLFLLATLHIFILLFGKTGNTLLMVYLVLLAVTGIGAYLYKEFAFPFLARQFNGVVTQVDRLNDRVMEIEVEVTGSGFSFVPGQFFFFRFMYPEQTNEYHPYTVCSIPGSKHIRIMVKSLGDYTGNLYKTLVSGAKVKMEGPYGGFYYRNSPPKQVWIAGGVGIAPFISWMRELRYNPWPNMQIDLYYCVNAASEATHIAEFEQFQQEQHDNFRLHLVAANTDGFLNPFNIPDIGNKTVFFCGPKAMRKAFLAAFRSMKLPESNIHYEDFDFS